MNKIALSILTSWVLFFFADQGLLAQTRSMSLTRAIAQEELLTYDVELAAENEAFAIYNGAHNKGFVIVSADDKLPNILGYSDSGYFDPNNVPPGLQFWMDYTKRGCEAIINGSASALEPYVATRAQQDISPLLGDISWGQDAPYNLKTPIYDGKNLVTGCVATAMAMIMKYHRYPEQGVGQINYKSKTNKLDISYDFGNTHFDYDKMLDCFTTPDFGQPTGETLNKDLAADLVCVSLVPSGLYKGVLVYADTLMCNKSGSFTGSVRFMLFNANDEFIEPVGEEKYISEQLPTNYFYTAYPLSASMPGRIEDGTYKLYLASKAEGSNEWALVKRLNPLTRKVLSPKPIEITKQGDKVTVGKYSSYVQYSEEEASEVAELMAACGAAVEMDYRTEEASAYSQMVHVRALEHFKYDQDAYLADCDYINQKDMSAMIVEQLENGNPVFIGGTDNSKKVGHAFVADGVRYNAYGSPLFHINWGWDGMSNGYFLITNFSPGSAGTGGSSMSNYSDLLDIICGLKPDDGIDEGPTISYKSTTCNKEDVTVGEKITIKLNNLINSAAYTINGSLYAFLVDEYGNEWKLGEIESMEDIKPLILTPLSYSNTFETTIPTSVPSGKYRIVARACQSTNPNVFGKALSISHAIINVNNPTGITQINDDSDKTDANGEAFDLNGRKVNASTHKGIMVKDNKILIH